MSAPPIAGTDATGLAVPGSCAGQRCVPCGIDPLAANKRLKRSRREKFLYLRGNSFYYSTHYVSPFLVLYLLIIATVG